MDRAGGGGGAGRAAQSSWAPPGHLSSGRTSEGAGAAHGHSLLSLRKHRHGLTGEGECHQGTAGAALYLVPVGATVGAVEGRHAVSHICAGGVAGATGRAAGGVSVDHQKYSFSSR
jgi:hypothetical protein